MITLNEGQDLARKQILACINRDENDDDKFITFSGAAGTGKTTTLVQIIKSLPNYLDIGMTAPTHKATKVIRRMAYKEGIDGRVDIRTIHSALGLTMKQEEGVEVLYRDVMVDEKIYDVLFIDECSMLDDQILEYIINCQSKTVVFVGDRCQISPVNAEPGELSKCFSEVNRQTSLTEVVRQANGNPIIDLATNFRLIQDDLYADWPSIETSLLGDGSGVEVLHRSAWFQKALSIFGGEEFKTNPDYCRCIAYTNDTVNTINKTVRQHLHGKDVPEYKVGEIIVAQGSGKMHKNAEEMQILELEEIDHDQYNIPCWQMKLSSLDENALYTVLVLKEEGRIPFQKMLDSHAERARMDPNNKRYHWKNFWDLRKTFDEFKHIYAMTAHKSQGSTVNFAMVYTPDFIKFGATMEVKQLMYTATTRASFRTIFAY